MDRDGFQRWLDRYIQAWRTYDRSAIEALFAPDAKYYYGPYADPVIGASKIADDWLESPDKAGSWEAEYRPLAVDGETFVANGESRYRSDDGTTIARAFNNIFVCRFNADGRCSEFREWYMERPKVAA
jgi:hypothetical protein